MFWVQVVIEAAKKRSHEKIRAGRALIVRDEKTASGRIHVGSLRGVVLHGALAEALTDAGISAEFWYEINDFDPFDDIPSYLSREKFEEHLGKPLCTVPSPDGKAANYAEYFAEEFIGIIHELGFTPKLYRASELYKTGRFNEAIKIAIARAPLIRRIYEEVSGGKRAEAWLPISVVCEKCGKIGTTKALSFDGEKVSYQCGDFVPWAKGCGHTGARSPFDGGAKLLWKVEWAAKFLVLDVDIEGAGKDHSTKGGSRDVADRIVREVFGVTPPVNLPYEFFHIKGKKMSTSRGAGASAREIADLLPPHLLRFLMLYKEPARVIDFDPAGDTVPVLYDSYDRYAEMYLKNQTDDYATIFRLSHPVALRRKIATHLLPRFSQIAYLVQMPHLSLEEEVAKAAAVTITSEDKKEIALRATYAKQWLTRCAPPDFRFEIQKTLPPEAASLSAKQKEALGTLRSFIEETTDLNGEVLHSKLHEIKTNLSLTPAEFFGPIYMSILGKASGPKAGWFLSVLPRDFLLKRLAEASA